VGRLNLILLITVLLAGVLYSPLNIAREPLHVLKSPFDNTIPFLSVFIIPYLSFYPFLIITLLALVGSKKYSSALTTALITTLVTLVVSFLTYFFFQTYVERPVVTGNDLFSKLIIFLYLHDQPYNDFPSLHTSLSTICLISWIKIRGRPWLWMVSWTAVIIFSVLFVKQHYFLGLAGGIGLAATSYWITNKSLQRFLKRGLTS